MCDVEAADRDHRIEAWLEGDNLFESYVYAPGRASELPEHSHDEYQFCLSLNFPGEYRYLREKHSVPVGSLSVVHPGEVHSARDPHDRRDPSMFRMLYATPATVSQVAGELNGLRTDQPFFEPVILDGSLADVFLRMHQRSQSRASALERHSNLLEVLVGFLVRHCDSGPRIPITGRERRAVREVRDYLHDHAVEKVSLERLSQLANLSRFHLVRVFREEVGLPPHAYQTQLRVGLAKTLLLGDSPISSVARQIGFADQSHLTRHFKRLVGVTPGSYISL